MFLENKNEIKHFEAASFQKIRTLSLIRVLMVLTKKRYLTLSWRRSLSYRNQSIDLRSESMDWFLYGNGLRHERVKHKSKILAQKCQIVIKLMSNTDIFGLYEILIMKIWKEILRINNHQWKLTRKSKQKIIKWTK